MTEAADRRRSPRIEGVVCTLQLEADDAAHDVVTWNVNGYGVLVFSRVRYPVGTKVILGSGAGWSASARVVRSKISWESRESGVSHPRITKSWKTVFALGLVFDEPQPSFWKQHDEPSA